MSLTKLKGEKKMQEILEIINMVGIIGATAISTITLFTTRSLQRSQQKATIMANKRSERIDLMREYSAGLISAGKQFVYGIESEETKKDLISFADKFNSLLQYEYLHDVELIDCAKEIVEICLSKQEQMEKLESKLQDFWKMCDVYVGVEYERLKIEAMGDIHGSGKVNSETKTFEDIYGILKAQQNEYTKIEK